MDVAAESPDEFERWRKSIHNVVSYRRRRCRWWREVGVWGWWDGASLTGVVELGSVASGEFLGALHRQGAITLRPIDVAVIRVQVYQAARAVAAAGPNLTSCRYQNAKITIEPAWKMKPRSLDVAAPYREPMAVLI